MFVIDALVENIRKESRYNRGIQEPYVCILWPDKDKQWKSAIPRLIKEIPEMLILDEYKPENKMGPAIWLRCVIANQIEEMKLDNKNIPIIYLPGVSRQDLRAVESCPDNLKPIAELQYRGVFWSQQNTKDWTILAFLKSDQGGLGLDVAQDNDTKESIRLALRKILVADINLLKDKRLDKDFFNDLMTGGDYNREILQWLDLGEKYKESMDENEWKAFLSVCKSKLKYDPDNDGILVGAERLANHEGPWKSVWDRFCEAPKRYPNIPNQIRKTSPPENTLFLTGWPQWNEQQESKLRDELLKLVDETTKETRKKVTDLESLHSNRRKLVWTELGESPLACALEHLALIAKVTESKLNAGSLENIVSEYCDTGWKADFSVLQAIASVEKKEDCEAVISAIIALYKPWAEDSARYLQSIILENGYPRASASNEQPQTYEEGECVIFVDGLRYDIASHLHELLTEKGLLIERKINWAALPTVTATGKPACTPVREKIEGQEVNADFEPSIKSTGKSLKGGNPLKKLIKDAGWKILNSASTNNAEGNAWYEISDIDTEGHHNIQKLAKNIEEILNEIADRVTQLLNIGWKSVSIVTDHGWLLLPGGLPKIELPKLLTENKWGRCAAIKPGARTKEKMYPWYWNPSQLFALADGISCYVKGLEYVHGGLSLQECLLLELKISKGTKKSAEPEIIDVVWKRLRCSVHIEGEYNNLFLDIRTQPANSSSSIALTKKPFRTNGISSVVVEDENLEGSSAKLIIIDEEDNIFYQLDTIIGGNND